MNPSFLWFLNLNSFASPNICFRVNCVPFSAFALEMNEASVRPLLGANVDISSTLNL